ncbi:hypothetical protein ACISK3_10645 [Morganella morganii]|nr:hypothetical protein [Morganella morganii]
MTGEINSKQARILRYYRHQSALAEQQLAETRKTLRQLNHRQAELEQQKAALLKARAAFSADFCLSAVTTATRLDTLRQHFADMIAGTGLAEDALLRHAQTRDAVQARLYKQQQRLQRLTLKQQLISRNVF